MDMRIAKTMIKKFTQIALFTLFIFSGGVTAADQSKLLDSFGPGELKELKYLLSKKYKKEILYQQHSDYVKQHNKILSTIHLKQFAQTQKIKREQFLNNHPWQQWEKRENYNALQRWLQRISPTVNELQHSTKERL